MRVRILLALSGLIAVGCGDGDSAAIDGGIGDDRDGSHPIDAGPSVDADPSCVRWQLAPVGVQSAWLMESMPVHPDRSARLMVRTFQCPGDEPATPSWGFTLENEYVAIQMRVWRALGAADCDQPEVVDRPIVLQFPYAATWTVLTETDDLLVEVVDAPDIACGATSSGCALDCDCAAGERCLSTIGLGGPFSACVRPCEFDRDCLGDGVCLSVDDGFDFACESGIAECVDGTRPCPDGFACAAGTCTPEFTLNGTTRHACSCDSQCDPPLRCVWPETATEGRCDIACPTTGAAWCEGPHVCTPHPASVETGSDSVCAWVGE